MNFFCCWWQGFAADGRDGWMLESNMGGEQQRSFGVIQCFSNLYFSVYFCSEIPFLSHLNEKSSSERTLKYFWCVNSLPIAAKRKKAWLLAQLFFICNTKNGDAFFQTYKVKRFLRILVNTELIGLGCLQSLYFCIHYRAKWNGSHLCTQHLYNCLKSKFHQQQQNSARMNFMNCWPHGL